MEYFSTFILYQIHLIDFYFHFGLFLSYLKDFDSNFTNFSTLVSNPLCNHGDPPYPNE